MRRVDFELSDEQLALREAASSLLEGRAPLPRVRKVTEQEDRLDHELWAAMAEQGWLAVERPESEGGLGLGMIEVVVLAEQLGQRLAPVPFLGTVLAQAALSLGAESGAVSKDDLIGDVSVADWARRLAEGEAVGALAWSSPGRLDALSARTASAANAEESNAWTLSGRTGPVVYLPTADLVVVFADGTEGPALFAIATDGRARGAPEPAMDLTRSVSRLELADAPAIRLGGKDAAERLLDRAATAICAEMLGAAGHVLDMTVQYAKDRVQFGRPIGSFQAIKHRCADMLVDLEGMRSSVYYAGWAVGAKDPDAPIAASAAKIWCSDASSRLMSSALQVHGGIGFTWEHDMHLFLKRAQLDQVSFGDSTFHKERLALLLRPKAEAGLPIL